MQTNPAGQISKQPLSGIKTKLLLLSASHSPSLLPREKWRPASFASDTSPLPLLYKMRVCVVACTLLPRPQSGGAEGLNSNSGGGKSKADVLLSFPGAAVTHRHLSHASERAIPDMIHLASVLLTWAY